MNTTVQLEACTMNLKLKEPVSISFQTWTHQENVVVRLVDGDTVGLGEAAPFKPITLDSQEEVYEQIRMLGSLTFDPLHTTPEEFHALLDERGVSGHTTRAALDFAFHDLRGKRAGIPTYQLYGGEECHTPPNSVTLFIDTPEKMAAQAQSVLHTYPDLQLMKIKLQGDDADIARAKAIRHVVPDTIRFIIDANQGFASADEALRVLAEIHSVLKSIVLVEEPLPKGELDELKIVTDNIEGMMVFADESAVDVHDALQIIEKRAAHGINIKLQKAGGIWQGKRMAEAAEEAGLKVMVGCMLEGPLAIAGSVHFAASTPSVILTDLDMDLPLPRHTHTVCPFEKGSRLPLDAPGLGVELDYQAIDQLVQEDRLLWENVV